MNSGEHGIISAIDVLHKDVAQLKIEIVRIHELFFRYATFDIAAKLRALDPNISVAESMESAGLLLGIWQE